MPVEALVRTEQAQYYDLAHVADSKDLAAQELPAPFTRILDKCLKPFEVLSKRLKLFPADGEPYFPLSKSQERERFKAEASQVVAFYTKDLLDPQTSSADIEQTWRNLEEIAPQLVTILIDNENFIDGVSESQALNILAAALQVVRDPGSRVTFLGSTSCANINTTRLPSK